MKTSSNDHPKADLTKINRLVDQSVQEVNPPQETHNGFLQGLKSVGETIIEIGRFCLTLKSILRLIRR